MKLNKFTPSETTAIQPLEVGKLIAFSDSIGRAISELAMLATVDGIMNSDEPAMCGVCRSLSRIADDLETVMNDLSGMALEVRSHGRAMASRTGS